LSQGQQHQQHQQQQQQQQQHQQQQLRGKNSWTSVALNRLYGLFYFRYELLYAQGEGRGANGEHLAATCCPQNVFRHPNYASEAADGRQLAKLLLELLALLPGCNFPTCVVASEDFPAATAGGARSPLIGKSFCQPCST